MVPPSTPFNMVKIPNKAGFCNNHNHKNFPPPHHPHSHHYPHPPHIHPLLILLIIIRIRTVMKISNLLKDSHSACNKTGKDERQNQKESSLADLSSHLVHLGHDNGDDIFVCDCDYGYFEMLLYARHRLFRKLCLNMWYLLT